MSDPSNNSPEMPEDLKGALDGWQVPKADANFRARQKHAFLAAAKAGEPVSMEHATTQLDRWAIEPAREEFRADLRERFLAAAAEYANDASAEPSTNELRPVASAAALAPTNARPQRGPRPTSGVPKWVGTALAVAAAGVLYFGLGGPLPFGAGVPAVTPVQTTTLQGWQTVNYVPGDEVVLDGVVKMFGEDKRLCEALNVGNCRLETGDENLAVIHYGEGVLLEFPPETKLWFPPTSVGEKGLIEIEVLRGGLRVATNDKFVGRVLVHTPHTTISLSGHSLGIDVYAEGTCICTIAGDAEIRPLNEFEGAPAQHDVGSASTRFIRENGEVVLFPDGEVHHANDMESLLELGGKYLY